MTQYEHSLIAMKRLLEAVGEESWAKGIGDDIERWRKRRDAYCHLSKYGGMGSFNDLWLCRQNGHTITEAQDLWGNLLFVWLKSTCYFLAHHAEEIFSAEALADRIGRQDAVLAAFRGVDDETEEVSTKPNRTLQGWRCPHCGYTEVSHADIEFFVAEDLVPRMLFQACESLTLVELVDQIIAIDMPEAKALHEPLARAVTTAGITLVERNAKLRPCPHCAKGDLAVSRWDLISNGKQRFEPSDNNMPVHHSPQ